MEGEKERMMHAAVIYSHSLSRRLQYVVDFVAAYFDRSIRIVYDEDKYRRSPEALKINYGYHRLEPDEIFIHSHVLLFESSIRPVKIECFRKDDLPVFFKAEGEVGFDLFAAIFYLLTRYEEYLPHKEDMYGRYDHKESLAFREGFLHLPLVDLWLEQFRLLLMAKDKSFAKPAHAFRFLPTYDIDMAWVFRNKGFRRNAGGSAALFLKGRFRKMIQRISVARKKRQDPYDAYSWMHELHQKYALDPVYFFLVARELGRYDKNIDTAHPEFRELIRGIAAYDRVGLHPSWASGDHASLLTGEKATLENIIGQAVTASRQHYIRFQLPKTFQRLAALGISDDYTMGYGTVNGFRASVARSFWWYDLKRDETTTLRMHPFCFMDANSFYEEKQTPEQALAGMMELYETVKAVRGTMITIWHNSFLGISPEFDGWRTVYETFVRNVSNKN